MKILVAADGSSFTKKALAFLVTHGNIAGADDELSVLNVQLGVPARVKRMLGAGAVTIVMGTHGHGLIGRALMGSVAQRVIADCHVPVLLVK